MLAEQDCFTLDYGFSKNLTALTANTTLAGKNTAAPDSVYLTFTLPF